MRDIIFRAWDKDNRDMYFFNSELEMHDDRGVKYLLFGDNISRKESDGWEEIPFTNSNSLELMQYTGFKDKTGKDIYEGDICEREGFLCKVMFECGSWLFVHLPQSKTIQYPSFHSNARTMEVFGNVYENSELSGEKNLPAQSG